LTDIRVYAGYGDDDLQLFSRFDTSHVRPSPGFVPDWIGSRVRLASLWDGLEGANGTVQGLPIPCDYHAEAVEWIGTLKAVLEARSSFSVMELGAGHGPWLAASCAAARSRGLKELHLCGVEADPGRFALLQQNMADNNLLDLNTTLVQGAIRVEPGRARWPRILDPRNHSGARPLRESNADDAAYLARRYTEMIDVQIVALTPLLQQRPLWDLVHIDIQGTEDELCRGCQSELLARARYLVIGTHSRKLDADLMEIMSSAGWRLEHEKPTRIVCNPDTRLPKTRSDGTQVWRNPQH
jgi:FkbM family methyltransferase